MAMTRLVWVGLGSIAALAGAAPAALAETHVEGRLALVAAAGDQGAAADLEPLTLRADFFLDWARTLANGADIGVSAALAAERDHPDRDPRGGFSQGAPSGLRGAISGLSGAAGGREDLRGSIESAFVFVRGGWGEAALGRDEGVAARYSLPPPEALRTIGAFEASLDPAGLGAPVLRNDLSARGAKLSVETPRLLGFKAGLSHTPDSGVEGLDQGFEDRPGVATLEPERVWEAGLSFARTWRNGVETAAALTYAAAQAGGPAPFGRIESWSGGGRVAAGGLTLGFAALGSDGGAAGADYGAYGLGATLARGPWTVGVAAGRSDDDLVRTETRTASLAARRRVGEAFAVGAAYRTAERETPASQQDSEVLLLELTWSG